MKLKNVKQGKKNRLAINLFLIYFVIVFFYGIVIKITISNTLIFSLKSYLPELLLVLGCVVLVAENGFRLKIKRSIIVGLLYFLIVIIVNIAVVGLSSGGMYVIRDVFLPILVCIIISQCRITNADLQRFMSIFTKIGMVYLVSGAILGVVEVIKGYEWTSNFYTGYVFYGTDSYSKVRITEASGQLRAPGLTGSFVSFVFYGLISMITIITNKKIRNTWKVFFTVCEILILYATVDKTVFVIMVIVAIIYLFRKSGKYLRYLLLILAAIAGVIYFCLNQGENVFSSLLERFAYWGTLGDYTNFFELIFPYNSFSYNPNAEGIISFWDNTYLMFLFTLGIFGTIWILIFCYNLYKKNSRIYPDRALFFQLLFVFFIVSSLTNNITNGRAYFTIFLLLNSMYYKTEKISKIGELQSV